MEPDDLDALFRALSEQQREHEIDGLKRLVALPSPPAPRIESATCNAVLIDGRGHTREMNLLDFRHEYLVPMAEPPEVRFNAPPRFPKIARFTLSSVIDGKAVYRFAGIR